MERQIVLLSASVENQLRLLHCSTQHGAEGFHACAGRSCFGSKGQPTCVRSEVRGADRPHKGDRHRTRTCAARKYMDNFLAAGYRKDQVLEVLIGVALKTMSNYLDHISPTELDPAFQAEA